MKDILNLEVNIATKEGIKSRHLILTAENDEEIKEKIKDWLFITRLKDKGYFEGYTITHRLQPAQEKERPKKPIKHNGRERGVQCLTHMRT